MSNWYINLYGHVYKKDLIYFSAMDKDQVIDNPDHSIVFRFDGSALNHILFECELTAMDFVDISGIGRTGFFLCSSGLLRVTSPSQDNWEKISTGNNDPDSLRPLTNMRVIDNKLYIVGMLRQVFCRDLAIENWTRIDAGLLPGQNDDVAVGFESIDGFSNSEIYAVGLKGEIWIFNSSEWRKIDTLTNVNLSSVRCADDGMVYIAGDRGVIIQGRGDSWEIIEQDITEDNFTSIEYAFDALFLSVLGENIFQLNHGKLQKIMTMQDPFTTYHLHFNDGVLLSVGESDVVTYDGSNWKKLPKP